MSIEAVAKFNAKLVPALVKEMRVQMEELAAYLKKARLTGGTTRSKLAVRSGRLRGSVRVVPVERKRSRIETGINVGTVYGATHFGKAGKKTTIVPKTKQYLTIPLPAAKTKAGVARGAARSGMWGKTFVQRSKKGNLIIFGQRVAQKGASAGQARGKIVPLFLLVKSVEIPARIDMAAIARLWRPRIIKAMGRLAAKTTVEVE